MYKVIITTEDNLNKQIESVVNLPQYNRLLNCQNLGGFKRYDVELYSDNEPKQRSEIIDTLNFLAKNVFYCTLTELQTFL